MKKSNSVLLDLLGASSGPVSHVEEGEITVTTDGRGRCVAVTRTDDEGHILKVLWSAPKEDGAVYGIIDPDYGRAYTMIRKLAWEEGYAVGLHGSFTRDLDLIAVPWAGGRQLGGAEHLVQRILAATGLTSQHGSPETKPHGRRTWTLLFPDFGDPRFIDLSIFAGQSA